jgi:hypothetical protein
LAIKYLKRESCKIFAFVILVDDSRLLDSVVKDPGSASRFLRLFHPAHAGIILSFGPAPVGPAPVGPQRGFGEIVSPKNQWWS